MADELERVIADEIFAEFGVTGAVAERRARRIRRALRTPITGEMREAVQDALSAMLAHPDAVGPDELIGVVLTSVGIRVVDPL